MTELATGLGPIVSFLCWTRLVTRVSVAARRGGGVERIVAMIRSIPEDVLVAEKLLAALLLTAQSSSSQLLFHRLLLT